ncbi:hypothetical protein Tco_1186792, partial [Tanacetum coccineum]
MASHRSKSLYAIKECSTCGRLYTKECCSIGSLDDKILAPVPDSSPRCARCGTPIDGPSCHGCAFLRKKFDEDLLAYVFKKWNFQDFQDTSESSDDNTNVVNAPREPCVVNQTPCKSLHRKILHILTIIVVMSAVIHQMEFFVDNAFVNLVAKILPIVHPTCNYEAENSFAYVPKPNSFDNSPKFSYHPPQPQFETYLYFNIWGSEVRKKEKAYKEEKYAATCRYMLSVTCDDEDDYIPKSITPNLPIQEPDNSLNMGDEHLDTIPAMKSDEVIKSSVENLVPIPSEFE